MNTLRTVFAFVVLVCAIAFASAAYVLVTQTENWRDQHAKLLATTTETINKLKADNKTLTDERDAAIAKRDDWQKDVDRLNTELGNRDTAIAKLTNEKKDWEAYRKSTEDELRAINKKLTDESARNDELAKKVEEHRLAREAAVKAQLLAEDMQRNLEDDVKKLREELKIAGTQLESSKKLNDRYATVFGEDGLRLAQAAPAPTPLISGQVKSVDNPMRLVAISIGKDDGVRVGMTFEVVRTAGNVYVGRVRVLEVKDEEAICRIDTAMTAGAIVEGDHVTTRVQ